jgi:hypothetical protein
MYELLERERERERESTDWVLEQWLGVVLSGTESGGFALWEFPELLWTLVLFFLVVGDLIEISETSIVALCLTRNCEVQCFFV